MRGEGAREEGIEIYVGRRATTGIDAEMDGQLLVGTTKVKEMQGTSRVPFFWRRATCRCYNLFLAAWPA